MKRLLAVAILALGGAVALAACGGGSDTASTSASSTTKNESTAGTTKLLEGPSETPPTTLPKGLEPLPEAPKKGVSTVNLQCDFPTCSGFSKIFQEAAKDLGWHNKTIIYKTGQPQSAMTQAVNTPGVEFISISGVSPSTIKPQLEAAAEKGITVIKTTDASPPEPPTVPVSIANERVITKEAEGLMRWVISDSGGKAHVVAIGLPEVPIVVPGPKTAERVAEEECSECSAEELPVTSEEVAAGTVPSKVIAYLQAHPEINYIWGAFGNLTLGVPQALKTAGLAGKVKIVSMNGIEKAEAEALKNEEMVAFNVLGEGELGTLAIDAIARDLQGLEYPSKLYEELPQSWLCTPATAEECLEWETFPPGFLQKFETEIWQLPG
jgi:ribose transport system substrate-binding protein